MKKSFLILPLFCSALAFNSAHANKSTKNDATYLLTKNDKVSDQSLSVKWYHLVNSLKKKWGKLTDQDLEKVNGKKENLIEIIHEKYGDSKESIEKNVNDLLDKLHKEDKMRDEKLSGKWQQLVGSIKEKWGDLTDQDLEKVKGKKDQLIGLIKEKYGETKESAEEAINKLLDKLD